MINMQRAAIFVAVVEAGSFTDAAQTLGLTKAVVSASIKMLEKELGVSLLSRSTRHVSTTDTVNDFTSTVCAFFRKPNVFWTTFVAITLD